LHYILQYNFWIGFESNHFAGIWKRLKLTVWGPQPW